MVLKMHGVAANKAHRIIIGRTLGGRASFKALHECLKLHLPISFASTTLLIRGYFLILFDNEEGAIATRKFTMVDSSGLSLSFSRFSPDFDASAQGAEALLTHTIKMHFPDVHEQFRNAKALTIMANKLGEVLDIEAEDSYIKRLAGPMVTLEVLDISKLAGFIRIPFMSEGAGTANSIRQRILYSGLPNQCRKGRKFGHHARTCNTNLARPQEGPAHRNSPRRESSGGASAPKDLARNAISSIKPKPPSSTPTELQKKKGVASRKDSPAAMEPPQLPAQPSEGGNPDFGGSAQVASSKNPDSKGMRDHEMPDLPESATCPKSESHSEKGQGPACTPTANIKAPLDLLAREGSQRVTWEATPNPFATLGKKSKEDRDLSEPLVEPTGGWIFQGKKRNTSTLAPTRQESPQALLHTPQRDATLGEKRGLLHSEVHQSYFTSLGISTPANKEPFRVRIWPILIRENDDQKEVLMHSKPHTLLSLPLNIRYVGPAIEPEAEWTPNVAWADHIHQVELELEEQSLRFKFTISKRPQLEWSWQEALSRGGDGVHHPSPHSHGGKMGERSKKEAPSLEGAGANSQSRQ
ncbi:unnamed protein product [Sphagnum tenellum]